MRRSKTGPRSKQIFVGNEVAPLANPEGKDHIVGMSNMNNVIRISDYAGGAVLSGAINGASLFAELAPLLPGMGEAVPVLLDFGGVEVASASYLRESILALKAFARSKRSAWYPVLANASDMVVEEMDFVCQARADAMMACEMSPNGEFREIRLIGRLDQKQREAFEFVLSHSPCSARDLMEATATESERDRSPTAWNNRLNVLVEKGIIAESADGRLKLYLNILGGGRNGH